MLFIIWVIFSCSYGFAGLAIYSDFLMLSMLITFDEKFASKVDTTFLTN